MSTYSLRFVENTDFPEGPCDDDYIISSNGFRLSVSQGGRATCNLAGTMNESDAAKLIAEDMERNQFWPNIWYVNDHGNVDLCVISTTSLL